MVSIYNKIQTIYGPTHHAKAIDVAATTEMILALWWSLSCILWSFHLEQWCCRWEARREGRAGMDVPQTAQIVLGRQ